MELTELDTKILLTAIGTFANNTGDKYVDHMGDAVRRLRESIERGETNTLESLTKYALLIVPILKRENESLSRLESDPAISPEERANLKNELIRCNWLWTTIQRDFDVLILKSHNTPKSLGQES